MSASTHVIFRISKELSQKLRVFGDHSKSESLKAKQMLILAINDLDRRHLELILRVVAAMERAGGKSARSRRNDILEPFERVCNIIKAKVDAVHLVAALNENKRHILMQKTCNKLIAYYIKLKFKTKKSLTTT